MLVSKSKAAKLAGVSRTTIHRYAKAGTLSMTGEQVDTSELIRVFGQISEQGSTPEQVQATGHDVTGGVQGVLQGQVGLLEAQVRDLRQDRDHWREQSDRLADMLAAEQANYKLLTHQGKPDQASPLLTGAVLALILGCLGVLGWGLYQISL
jgi:hypothetical protein